MMPELSSILTAIFSMSLLDISAKDEPFLGVMKSMAAARPEVITLPRSISIGIEYLGLCFSYLGWLLATKVLNLRFSLGAELAKYCESPSTCPTTGILSQLTKD